MFKRIITGAAIAAVAFMTYAGAANADPTPKKSPAPPTRKKLSDRVVPTTVNGPQAFVTQASLNFNTEDDFANMVLRQGLSGHLRDYATKLMRDNKVMSDELGRIAKKNHFKVSKGIELSQMQNKRHMAKLDGIAFDKQMWNSLLKLHQQSLSIFKTEAASGANKEVALYAKQRLPVIAAHLSVVQKEAWGLTDAGKRKPAAPKQ